MLKIVQNLIPFQKTSPTPDLQGDLQRSSSELRLTFRLKEPQLYTKELTPFSKSGDQVPRAHDLWKDTCFEMFLKVPGKTEYYEFNFSLTPCWNLYFFENYREPQPPQESQDFELKKIEWDTNELTVYLGLKKDFPELEVSLTAVLKVADKVHYMAINHAGVKADFHDFKSFILKR